MVSTTAQPASSVPAPVPSRAPPAQQASNNMLVLSHSDAFISDVWRPFRAEALCAACPVILTAECGQLTSRTLPSH